MRKLRHQEEKLRCFPPSALPLPPTPSRPLGCMAAGVGASQPWLCPPSCSGLAWPQEAKLSVSPLSVPFPPQQQQQSARCPESWVLVPDSDQAHGPAVLVRPSRREGEAGLLGGVSVLIFSLRSPVGLGCTSRQCHPGHSLGVCSRGSCTQTQHRLRGGGAHEPGAPGPCPV